jgi:hypothetical protein
MKLEFSRQIFEKIQISNFIKIPSVGAELFYVDRQTDGQRGRQTYMTKLIVAFRNFTNVPQNVLVPQICQEVTS